MKESLRLNRGIIKMEVGIKETKWSKSWDRMGEELRFNEGQI